MERASVKTQEKYAGYVCNSPDPDVDRSVLFLLIHIVMRSARPARLMLSNTLSRSMYNQLTDLARMTFECPTMSVALVVLKVGTYMDRQ